MALPSPHFALLVLGSAPAPSSPERAQPSLFSEVLLPPGWPRRSLSVLGMSQEGAGPCLLLCCIPPHPPPPLLRCTSPSPSFVSHLLAFAGALLRAGTPPQTHLDEPADLSCQIWVLWGHPQPRAGQSPPLCSDARSRWVWG